MSTHYPSDHIFTREYLEYKLSGIIEKTLGEIDTKKVFAKTVGKPKITGIAGDVIEQSVLGYKPDRKQFPDILVDGISTEVKTTGVRYDSKSGYSAKEPVTITAVSIDTIGNEQFEDSHFWSKVAHLLMVYYLYDAPKGTVVPSWGYADFPVKGYEFYKVSDDNKALLEHDWTIIRDFIKDIQDSFANPETEYPRLSHDLRSELLVLDTAPKYPNPPRFRFKQSFANTIVTEYFNSDTHLEHLKGGFSSYSEFDKKCSALASQYSGKTFEELIRLFGIKTEMRYTSVISRYSIFNEKIKGINKSIGATIALRMFGCKSNRFESIDEFSKIGLIGKTVTLTKNGGRTEDMKLFRVHFDTLMEEESFEESEFYAYFSQHSFLMIVCEEPSSDAPLIDNKFIGFKRFCFDEKFIQTEVKWLWNEMRSQIANKTFYVRDKINKDGSKNLNPNGQNYRQENSFPKKGRRGTADHHNVFIKLGAIDSLNKTEVLNGYEICHQYVWIDGSYIADKVNCLDYLK